jgi:prepilin signal peptidase PulO-like enzyme (type II secretory pathway)
MKFIRSTIPVPIIFAVIGVVVFGLTDLLTGKLLGRFVVDVGAGALASTLWGAVMGYLVGWFILRKAELPASATPYAVDAAVAKKRSAERSEGKDRSP